MSPIGAQKPWCTYINKFGAGKKMWSTYVYKFGAGRKSGGARATAATASLASLPIVYLEF